MCRVESYTKSMNKGRDRAEKIIDEEQKKGRGKDRALGNTTEDWKGGRSCIPQQQQK